MERERQSLLIVEFPSRLYSMLAPPLEAERIEWGFQRVCASPLVKSGVKSSLAKWLRVIDWRGRFNAAAKLLDKPSPKPIDSKPFPNRSIARLANPVNTALSAEVLSDDSAPHLPRINAPGKCEAYAKDSCKFVTAILNKVDDGSFLSGGTARRKAVMREERNTRKGHKKNLNLARVGLKPTPLDIRF